MSVEEEVFSNADLARRFISMGAPELLTASRSLRDAHQPCARFYERAKVSGCNPQMDEERACLRSVGGPESTLCTGEYNVTSIKQRQPVSTSLTAAAMVDTVLALLAERRKPHETIAVTISHKQGSVTIQRGEMTLLTVRKSSGQARVRCHLTAQQLEDTVHTLFKRIGRTRLTCPANSVEVPRRLTVRVTRRNDLLGQEWALLTAQRS
jgi:hypothetical protein